MWYLEEIKEKRRYGPITDDTFIIGRNPNANIILKRLQVSRRHCILVLKDHSVSIQDLGSANGIFINETKMDPNSERTLTENDLVGVGNDVSQIENGCVFRLLKVDENVNTDNITTLEMKSLNGKSQAKRPSNWDNMNERSSKKLKTNLNGQNENNEFPSTSKSDENKIETNGIKIEAMDENSVDMFSENPIEKHQIKTENITILSLLDSDEEENAYIDNNYVPPKHDDGYIIISSDDDDDDEEEDNPWLERLSQRSNYSPPPLSDSWAEKEGGENNEWWPELSQKFLDEINQEDETPDPNKVHNNIKTSKEPDKNSNKIELKECRITIQDVNKCFKNNETLNSIVNNLRKERPGKYTKPPIIEAPVMTKPVKEPKKVAVKSSTETIEKKDKNEKKDVKQKSSKKSIKDYTKRNSKTPEKVIKKKDDPNSELRKQRLKELAIAKSNKSEQSPNTDHKEKMKPKVKCTTRNRSDLFTAEILKTSDKPATCISKSTEKLSVGKPSTRNSKSNDKIPTLKSTEISHKYPIRVKSNDKLLPPTINYNEIIGNNDSIKKLPSFKKKEIIQNTETNKQTSNKNKSTKRVSFNLTPSIRLFTRESHEEAPPFFLFRDRRPLLKISEHDCFYQEDIIYEIVNWDPKSLLTPNTPINLMKHVQQNNIVYDSFQKYYHTIKNLMMLELWSLIQDEYNMNDSLKRVFQVDIKNLHVTSEQMQKNQKMFNLECQLLLTKQDDQNMIHPKIGDALILKLTTENKNGIQESTNRFGYVTSIHKQSIHQTRDELPLHLMMLVNNPQVLVTFMVLTKWDPNKLVTENCIPVRRLGRIMGVMKEFTALQKLPQSPLMPLILNPNNLNKIKNHYNVEILSNSALNVDQREIIFQVTGSCLSSDPTISLIHGPPGTGKSFLIVNLVMHLLYGNNRYNNCVENRNNLPRILICAPTNSAIDDIVLKLLNVRKKIAKPQITFRMVRVGQRNKMHPSVQSISLQTLKEYNSNLGMFKESDGFNKALNNKQNSQMNNIKNDALFQQNKPRKVIDEDIIIKKADIICTTLGSSYSAQLERLAKTKSFRFTTCIIDEATQCTEPTALLPLMLGIDSLVLVGDTKQLPATIKSQEAKKYGLGQSLFERIEKCFSMNNIDNCPNIRSLSVQYRMHPEIMEFPNKYFYGNRLKNSQNVYDYRFPLIPYQLFLHEFEQCSSMDNSREAEFILNMLKTILNEVNNKVTIGIITPYQNQRTRIMKILENIERKEDIVVNTVDGFQGQEKDIIILSCVRTEGFGFLADDQRLNVALTRAKHAFYIVGNFQALQMNPTWRALKDDAEHRKKIFYTKNVMISQDVFSKILKDKNFVK